MTIVWLYRDTKWCILRAASHVSYRRITTLCLASLEYGPINVTTSRPDHTCPACETELRAGTPGAAVAVEPAVSRTRTANLRARTVEMDDLGEEWSKA